MARSSKRHHRSDTKMGNRSSKKKSSSLASVVDGRSFDDDTPPFATKDSSCCDIVILNSGHLNRTIDGAGNTLMDSIHKVFDDGENKSSIARSIFGRRRNIAKTLSFPGYRILAMSPKDMFSRMRDVDADNWRSTALRSADAFIFTVNLPEGTSAEDYLQSNGERRRTSFVGNSWERDRFELARYMRSPELMENPKKPLLLLVHHQHGDIDDGMDLERLANLLGVNNLGRRPFHAISYSTSSDNHKSVEGDDAENNTGVLMEALKWLTKTASSTGEEDESTAAMTGNDTEDEEASSVATFSTMNSTATFGSNHYHSGHYVMDYEPTLLGGNPTLQRFQPIKNGTHCPFAKSAKLWGGKLTNDHVPRLANRVDEVKEIATLNAHPLAEFAARAANGEALDGFCLEIPHIGYAPAHLGKNVHKLFTELCALDPSGENAMKTSGVPIDHPQWRFRFNGEDFFLTTFGPEYNQDHSRYAFGASSSFILFQPLISFGRHGLYEDTPASATNWTNPTSMRDKARVAFKENGCPYHIPEEVPYPVAEHVVKPMKDDDTSVVKWWLPPEKKESRVFGDSSEEE